MCSLLLKKIVWRYIATWHPLLIFRPSVTSQLMKWRAEEMIPTYNFLFIIWFSVPLRDVCCSYRLDRHWYSRGRTWNKSQGKRSWPTPLQPIYICTNLWWRVKGSANKGVDLFSRRQRAKEVTNVVCLAWRHCTRTPRSLQERVHCLSASIRHSNHNKPSWIRLRDVLGGPL